MSFGKEISTVYANNNNNFTHLLSVRLNNVTKFQTMNSWSAFWLTAGLG